MIFPNYVISLKRSKERRREISRALGAQNMAFSFVDAIDASGPEAAMIHDQIDITATKKRLYREMTTAEYACALSHQKAYRLFLETDAPFALFFEDDAIIDDRLNHYLQSPECGRQDIVLFYHTHGYVSGDSKDLTDDFTLRRFTATPFYAVGYGLNRKAAQILCNANTPISYTADWPIDFAKLSSWGCVPPLINHPEKSDTQSEIGLARPKPKPPISRIFSCDYLKRKARKLTSTRVS